LCPAPQQCSWPWLWEAQEGPEGKNHAPNLNDIVWNLTPWDCGGFAGHTSSPVPARHRTWGCGRKGGSTQASHHYTIFLLRAMESGCLLELTRPCSTDSVFGILREVKNRRWQGGFPPAFWMLGFLTDFSARGYPKAPWSWSVKR